MLYSIFIDYTWVLARYCTLCQQKCPTSTFIRISLSNTSILPELMVNMLRVMKYPSNNIGIALFTLTILLLSTSENMSTVFF